MRISQSNIPELCPQPVELVHSTKPSLHTQMLQSSSATNTEPCVCFWPPWVQPENLYLPDQYRQYLHVCFFLDNTEHYNIITLLYPPHPHTHNEV